MTSPKELFEAYYPKLSARLLADAAALEDPLERKIATKSIKTVDVPRYGAYVYALSSDEDAAFACSTCITHLIKYILFLDKYYEGGEEDETLLKRKIVEWERAMAILPKEFHERIAEIDVGLMTFWALEKDLSERMVSNVTGIEEAEIHLLTWRKSSDVFLYSFCAWVWSRHSSGAVAYETLRDEMHRSQMVMDLEDDTADLAEDIDEKQATPMLLRLLKEKPELVNADPPVPQEELENMVKELGVLETQVACRDEYIKTSLQALPETLHWIRQCWDFKPFDEKEQL